MTAITRPATIPEQLPVGRVTMRAPKPAPFTICDGCHKPADTTKVELRWEEQTGVCDLKKMSEDADLCADCIEHEGREVIER